MKQSNEDKELEYINLDVEDLFGEQFGGLQALFLVGFIAAMFGLLILAILAIKYFTV